MFRHIAVVACAVIALAVCLSGSGALAESRVALVIGNSAYRSVVALPNPVNDAKAVAAELGTAGFDVTPALDLGQADMRRAIRDFAAKIAAKGPDSIALVFYAGHGVQVDGENFLVPVDARIQRESDIAIEAVRLADLMNALAAVPSKMRIVILDACRNNPFEPTKQTRGLAIVDAPTGSIVAYSTAPGTEATDGAGANSPYTAAFLEVAKQPKLQIEQLFKQVRLKVHQATNGQQTPWESSSLTSDFWFLPVEETAPAVVAAATAPAPDVPRLPMPRPASAPPLPTPVVASSRTTPTSAPTTTPASAPTTVAATSPATPAPAPRPSGYPPLAPSGPTTLAATPPAQMQAQSQPVQTQVQARARIQAPVPAQAGYAAALPPPPAPQLASISGMSPDDAYDYVIEEDSVPAYEEFLLFYPYDPRAEWVRTSLALRVDAIAWRYAVVVNTPAAYAAYAARYPGGVYVDDAVRLRVQPRLRAMDAVIAPRFLVAPPAPRIALPLIQSRRPPGVALVLPVVHTFPSRLRPASLSPGQRLPGVNPGFAPRMNAITSAPGQFPRSGPGGAHQNLVTGAPGQNLAPQNKLPNTNTLSAVSPHPGAIHTGPGGGPQFHEHDRLPGGPYRENGINGPGAANPQYHPAGGPPVANLAPGQGAQPPGRPFNAQFHPQRAQLGPKPAKCAGRGCRR